MLYFMQYMIAIYDCNIEIADYLIKNGSLMLNSGDVKQINEWIYNDFLKILRLFK